MTMDINDFSIEVAKQEGKLKEVNIAQIKEILKVINKLTNGILYAVIKIMPY